MSSLRQLQWIEELLPADLHMIPKHGGQAYLSGSNLVLILVEHPESQYEHKGVTYPFDLWKGCLFPVEKQKQNAFFLKYLFLENHPANKNWLYIPAESENFEDEVKLMLREIVKKNPLLGIPFQSASFSTEKAESKAGPKKKSRAKKIKADKKRENAFYLSMMDRKK